MSHDQTTTVPALAAAADSARVRKLAALAAFAALTAIGARMSVPLPGTPVPFTLQPVAVLLAGLLLGPALGAGSQMAYLAAGAAGLPVFAAGGGLAYVAGPTGGYLMAFPVAAAVAGWIAGDLDTCPPLRRTLRLGAAAFAGLAAIHLGGASWLSIQPWLAGGTAEVFQLSFEPFLFGDLLKIGLVAVIAIGAGPRVRRWLG